MWERSEVKRQTKVCLKQYYWQAVLFMLLFGLITVAVNLLSGVIPLVGLLIPVFVGNVIMVGMVSYFRKQEQGQRDVGIGELFGLFDKEAYLNVVCVQFLMSLKLILWTLLLIIPGIIKRYEYFMVPYLVGEYPQKDHKELFRLSKEMMAGNKLKTWLLEFSFIGWFILGSIPCGIGLIFVLPYYQATLAELYLKLKEQKLGIPRNDSALEDVQGTAGGQGYFAGVQGALAGVNYPVLTGVWMTLGSDASRCNLLIGGAQTSPIHMQIYFDGSQFYVVDYSAAGTCINQQGYLPKEQTVPVLPGTYFRIGSSDDLFVLTCQ